MAAAPLAFVKEIGSYASLTTGTSSLTRPVTNGMSQAGNFLACFVAWNSTTQTLTSITDTQSNTWTTIGTIVSANRSGALVVCYAPKRLTNDDTISATFSAGSNGCAFHVLEFSGVKATGTPLDVSNTGIGAAATPATFNSGNATTAVANDLLLGLCFSDAPTGDSTPTGSGTWTRPGTRPAFVNGNLRAMYQIVSATGTYNCTGTTTITVGTVTWGAGMWAFKQSDTNAPQVSGEGAEVAFSGANRAATSVGAEVAFSGPYRATTFIGAEVAASYSHAGVTFVGAEVAYVPAPLPRRLSPQVIG